MFDEDIEKDKQAKNDPGVFVTTRQISAVVAVFLFVNITVFIAGYFWGQRKILESVSSRLEQDSFSDRISSSMVSLYDSAAQSDDAQEDDQEDEKNEHDGSSKGESAVKNTEAKTGEPDVQVSSVKVQDLKDDVQQKAQDTGEEQDKKSYFAQLVGGTNKAMIQFQQRLKKHGITTVVKRRKGQTKKGETITWHQAVTETHENKKDLDNLVDKIKKIEKLKDINIVTVKL